MDSSCHKKICRKMKKCNSSSSSSCSDTEKKCCDVKCTFPLRDECNPEELVCRYKSAVVEIHSEFILLGEQGPVNGATGGTPLSKNGRYDAVLEGNGFFIKGHYIVAPAQLVLMPPSLTPTANRYPFYKNQPLDANSRVSETMVRASKILVSVFNVNNKGNSFVYEADLIGVDGAGDIAVLKINYNKQWNKCNPCVEKCHPVLSFGYSRAANDGEKVYFLGDAFGGAKHFNNVGGITPGLISSHRYADYNGSVLAEMLLVNSLVKFPSVGLPIINCLGLVLGMQTTNLDECTQFVAGPSEFFMRRVIKIIIKGIDCNNLCNTKLEIIEDPLGSYYRYKKAYLGIGYSIVTGPDYDITADFVSGNSMSGAQKIRLDEEGNFLSNPTCKELIGLKVLGIAGLNPNDSVLDIPNGLYYVPGGTAINAPLPLSLPISPLINKLVPGDIITHINTPNIDNQCDSIAMGDLNSQIVPSLLTWRLCAGSKVEVVYRKGGNLNNASDNSMTENYDRLYSTIVTLLDYPIQLDYPWYAICAFPTLSAGAYPGFTSRLSDSQLLKLANSNIFKTPV